MKDEIIFFLAFIILLLCSVIYNQSQIHRLEENLNDRIPRLENVNLLLKDYEALKQQVVQVVNQHDMRLRKLEEVNGKKEERKR